eukprot:c21124_g2_i1.p1 GENE.c21124_g2_i1~~c21124_g2_i1.p1  ORF type:complete len:499 (+),score=178.63 c21124_g2_i1:26-1498(+)
MIQACPLRLNLFFCLLIIVNGISLTSEMKSLANKMPGEKISVKRPALDFWNQPTTNERLERLKRLQEEENRGLVTGIYRAANYYSAEELSKKVTLVIKTFERPSCLLSYIESIVHTYPTLDIVIADDSKDVDETYVKLLSYESEKVHYFALPFDSGAGAGRNFLIDKVETPFVIISDDDLLFTEQTQLEALLADIESSGADIVGSCYGNSMNSCDGDTDLFYKDKIIKLNDVENPKFGTLQFSPLPHEFMHILQQRNGVVNGTHTPFCKESDFVGKFFIARTAFIALENKWDPFFKVGEDYDFFYRAKLGHSYIRYCANTKVTVQDDYCSTLEEEKRYQRFHQRNRTYTELFLAKHSPLKKLEFPEYTVHWDCECEHSESGCPEDMKNRTDCQSYWETWEGPYLESSYQAGGALVHEIQDEKAYQVSPVNFEKTGSPFYSDNVPSPSPVIDIKPLEVEKEEHKLVSGALPQQVVSIKSEFDGNFMNSELH